MNTIISNNSMENCMFVLNKKNINEKINVDELKHKKYIKLVAGSFVSSTLFSSCAKYVDCNIKVEHAHYFVSDDGL